MRLLQATPRVNVSAEKAKALTERIQDAGTEVVKAKVGNLPPFDAIPCHCVYKKEALLAASQLPYIYDVLLDDVLPSLLGCLLAD